MKPEFKLEDFKRENVYNVPENYFDKLPNRIMQRVTAAPEKTPVTGWLSPWRLAFAGTGFAAIFATVFMLNTQETEISYSNQLARINQTEIVNYLLASEQLERNDLTYLSAADRDFTSEFINVENKAISEVLENETIDETYL